MAFLSPFVNARPYWREHFQTFLLQFSQPILDPLDCVIRAYETKMTVIRPSFHAAIISVPNVRILFFKFLVVSSPGPYAQAFFEFKKKMERKKKKKSTNALLDCVSRGHGMGICPSSVHPSVWRPRHIYLRIYWVDFAQMSVVACPGTYGQTFFLNFWKIAFSNFWRFFLFSLTLEQNLHNATLPSKHFWKFFKLLLNYPFSVVLTKSTVLDFWSLRFFTIVQLCFTLSAELLSSVRRPSVNSCFSDTAAWIQAKFY